ncbi:hypothetical protein DSECCO2_638090 [anaerobic digester metagenome]
MLEHGPQRRGDGLVGVIDHELDLEKEDHAEAPRPDDKGRGLDEAPHGRVGGELEDQGGGSGGSGGRGVLEVALAFAQKTHVLGIEENAENKKHHGPFDDHGKPRRGRGHGPVVRQGQGDEGVDGPGIDGEKRQHRNLPDEVFDAAHEVGVLLFLGRVAAHLVGQPVVDVVHPEGDHEQLAAQVLEVRALEGEDGKEHADEKHQQAAGVAVDDGEADDAEKKHLHGHAVGEGQKRHPGHAEGERPDARMQRVGLHAEHGPQEDEAPRRAQAQVARLQGHDGGEHVEDLRQMPAHGRAGHGPAQAEDGQALQHVEGRGDEPLVAVEPGLGKARAHERQKRRIVHRARHDVFLGHAVRVAAMAADGVGQKRETPGVDAEIAVYETRPDFQGEPGQGDDDGQEDCGHGRLPLRWSGRDRRPRKTRPAGTTSRPPHGGSLPSPPKILNPALPPLPGGSGG